MALIEIFKGGSEFNSGTYTRATRILQNYGIPHNERGNLVEKDGNTVIDTQDPVEHVRWILTPEVRMGVDGVGGNWWLDQCVLTTKGGIVTPSIISVRFFNPKREELVQKYVIEEDGRTLTKGVPLIGEEIDKAINLLQRIEGALKRDPLPQSFYLDSFEPVAAPIRS